MTQIKIENSSEPVATIALPDPADVDGLTLVGVQVEADRPTRERKHGAPWIVGLRLKLTYHGLPEGTLKTRTANLTLSIASHQGD